MLIPRTQTASMRALTLTAEPGVSQEVWMDLLSTFVPVCFWSPPPHRLAAVGSLCRHRMQWQRQHLPVVSKRLVGSHPWQTQGGNTYALQPTQS